MTELTVTGNRAIVLAHGTNVATFYVRHFTLSLNDPLTGYVILRQILPQVRSFLNLEPIPYSPNVLR